MNYWSIIVLYAHYRELIAGLRTGPILTLFYFRVLVLIYGLYKPLN